MQNNSGKVPAGSHGDVMLEGQLYGYGAHCADIETSFNPVPAHPTVKK